MAKFYAVKVGRNPGVYNTWDDCKLETDNYNGAIYRSFKDRNEALDFVQGKEKTTEEKGEVKSGKISFYTDGSYNEQLNEIGFGVVCISDKDEMLFKDCGRVPAKDKSLRNVLGEIYGVIRAIQLAYANGYKDILICHDYEGVAKWTNGEWKAKDSVAKHYVEYVEKARKEITIEFIHVKAHNNNKWNSVADGLANLGTNL